MSEVKRFKPVINSTPYKPYAYCEENEDGIYVRIDDYEAIKAERDALAAEVTNTREQAEHVYAAGYNHGHLNTVDGIAYAPGTKDEFYHNALQVMMEAETPATDAYLNSVRAEGVEMFGSALKDKYEGIAYELIGNYETNGEEDRISDEGEVQAVFHFANQLRAGEPS